MSGSAACASMGSTALAAQGQRVNTQRLTDAASLLNGRGKCNIGNRFSHTHTHRDI